MFTVVDIPYFNMIEENLLCLREPHVLHTFHRRKSKKNKRKSMVGVSQMAGDVQQGSFHRHHFHVYHIFYSLSGSV